MALDGNSTLFLKLHVVEHLPFSNLNGIGEFQQTIGNGALTVVDVGNNTKVSNMLHLSFYPFKVQKYEFSIFLQHFRADFL